MRFPFRKSFEVVGYTGNADHFCPSCAEAQFGPDSEDREDSESNPVHPIFLDNIDSQNPIVCNLCWVEIA